MPKKVIGRKVKGIGLAKILNFPTINFKTDVDIPCGIYTGDTKYGRITLISAKYSNGIVDCNFHIFNKMIDNDDEIVIHNIKKINNDNSYTLKTFNDGCNC